MFKTETFSTKIGLSIVAVTGFSSLRDELPNFARSENDRQSFDDSLDHVSRFSIGRRSKLPVGAVSLLCSQTEIRQSIITENLDFPPSQD